MIAYLQRLGKDGRAAIAAGPDVGTRNATNARRRDGDSMNPLLQGSRGGVTQGWIMGIITALFLASFLFWVWYAWAGRNRARWEEASRLPFNDGGES